MEVLDPGLTQINFYPRMIYGLGRIAATTAGCSIATIIQYHNQILCEK